MGNSAKFRADQARRMTEFIEQSRQVDSPHEHSPKNADPKQLLTNRLKKEASATPSRLSSQTPGRRQLFNQYNLNIAALGHSAYFSFTRKHGDSTKLIVEQGNSGFSNKQLPRCAAQGVNLRQAPAPRKNTVNERQALNSKNEARATTEQSTNGAKAAPHSQPNQELPALFHSHRPPPLKASKEAANMPRTSNDNETTNWDFQYNDDDLAFYKFAEGAHSSSGEVPGLDPKRPTTPDA